MEIKTFRDLIAWQKSMMLAKETYKATSLMPDTERFGLTAQMRRAAVSIPSNIAEGHGRQSRPDYIRFLKTARGSLMELQTQVLLAQDLDFIRPPPNSAICWLKWIGSCRDSYAAWKGFRTNRRPKK